MIDGLHDGTPYFRIQSRCLKTSAMNQKTTNQQCLNFEIPKNCKYLCLHHMLIVLSILNLKKSSRFIACSFTTQIYTKCLQAKNQSRFHGKNAAIVAFLQICHLLVVPRWTPSPMQHTNNRSAPLVLTWHFPIWPMGTVHHLRASRCNGSFGCCS